MSLCFKKMPNKSHFALFQKRSTSQRLESGTFYAFVFLFLFSFFFYSFDKSSLAPVNCLINDHVSTLSFSLSASFYKVYV